MKNVIKHDTPFFAQTQKEEAYDGYYLLFKSVSMLNHSCDPNTFKSYFREDSSVVFVKAIRDISENEEITCSYVDLLMSLLER